MIPSLQRFERRYSKYNFLNSLFQNQRTGSTEGRVRGLIQLMKCKQKISGGFRSFDFAVSFANIRSFLSTASKRGLNLLEVVTDALLGNVSVFFSSIPTS